MSRSACQEVANSNLVFIGTVQAIQPTVLDPWRPNQRNDWKADPLILALKTNRSEAGLNRLKDRYLNIFFDLPANEKLRLQAARSQEELQRVIDWIVSQGTQVKFKVQKLIRRSESDDDDARANDELTKTSGKEHESDKTDSEPLLLWNEPGSCGIRFQQGETYLVYATNDEETDRMETNVCHRTARISDAGEDLTYLFFNQSGGPDSTRLEGFVTSEIHQLQQDPFHYTGRIGSPIRDVVIKLSSLQGIRYSAPDEDGRFVFDGLTAGDYQVSALDDREFPKRTETLAGPKQIRLPEGGCVTTTLLVLTAHEDR